jgi:hypothetical protein
MVNDCIRIGLQNNTSILKKLCQLSYHQLSRYDIVAYYKLCAISKAAGILANRKKSLRRGYDTKDPHMRRLLLISCYGFKLHDDTIRIPLGDRQFFDIRLNSYVKSIISDDTVDVRSFTLTPDHVIICYSKETKEIECIATAGVDRNLSNLTVGNCQTVFQYDMEKAVQIAENTRGIVKSLKRNDARIRKKLVAKYGRRREDRVAHL